MSNSLAGAGVGPQPAAAAIPQRPDSFEDIVTRYLAWVTRSAYRITQNIDDARDVAQFVFMQLYIKSPAFADRRAAVRWLYVVTRNRALSVHFRRQREAAVIAFESGHQPPAGLEDIVLQNERGREVRATIASLPAAHRRLIELRHLLSVPSNEIADQLGIPIQRVKRDVERARFRLRVEMLRRGLDAEVI